MTSGSLGTVADALGAAMKWVEEQARSAPGYRGAYVAGSVARIPDDAPIPAGSDVDVMVVLDGNESHIGKQVGGALVIEGTTLSSAIALNADAVLRDYHLAPGMVSGRILDDPSGDIARVQGEVRARYAHPDTIMTRLDDVEARVRTTLGTFDDGMPLPSRITRWQFGVGQLAHMILVAGLENPTVRKRYILASQVLSRFDEEIAYERLLRLAHLNRLRLPAIQALACSLDELLGIAGPVADGSDWRFASDISTPMRPIIRDGIDAMIRDGWPREAMFWIVATWCRCAQLLEQEAPNALQGYPHLGIDRLRAHLQVGSDAELEWAVDDAREAIGQFRSLADGIAERSQRS